jgi:hypothetical protein
MRLGIPIFIFFAMVSSGFSDLLPNTTAQANLTLVDPESTVQISTVTAAEPPVRVRLPEVVAESDQWRGVQCAVTMPRQAVFRRADKWATFWTQGMAPFSPKFKDVPAIDFSKDMVVGAFMGEKPDPHYEIEIKSVRTEQRDNVPVLVVRYRNIAKMEGVFSPPFAIQPFHLKRVPAFQGLIVFEEVSR